MNRELDAKIAMKFFGWRWTPMPWSGKRGEPKYKYALGCPAEVARVRPELVKESVEPNEIWTWNGVIENYPHYSKDMNAAMEVVAELRKRYSRVELHSVDAVFCCLIEQDSGKTSAHYVADTEADHPAEAICKAAMEVDW